MWKFRWTPVPDERIVDFYQTNFNDKDWMNPSISTRFTPSSANTHKKPPILPYRIPFLISRIIRLVDFYQTNFNDKDWTDFPVPANWEINGYGTPIYDLHLPIPIRSRRYCPTGFLS